MRWHVLALYNGEEVLGDIKYMALEQLVTLIAVGWVKGHWSVRSWVLVYQWR